jgi:hypothetical protein
LWLGLHNQIRIDAPCQLYHASLSFDRTNRYFAFIWWWCTWNIRKCFFDIKYSCWRFRRRKTAWRLVRGQHDIQYFWKAQWKISTVAKFQNLCILRRKYYRRSNSDVSILEFIRTLIIIFTQLILFNEIKFWSWFK